MLQNGRYSPAMKLFRYRRPSLKTMLGITRAKKRLKKELGITALLKPVRWWPNQKRRFKRRIGYYSDAGRMIRDGLPRAGRVLGGVPSRCKWDDVDALTAGWLELF